MTKIDWKNFFISFWLALLTVWLGFFITHLVDKIHGFESTLLYGGLILGLAFLIFLFAGLIKLLMLTLLKFILPLIFLLIAIYSFINLFRLDLWYTTLYTVALGLFLIIITKKYFPFGFSYLKRKKVISDYFATKKSENKQGTDPKLLEIDTGRLLKKLNFIVMSESPYWRAGMKFISPSSTLFPLLSDRSFLIHVGRNSPKDKLSLHLYHDGKRESGKSKHEELQYESYKPAHISVERNKNNHVYFKVNNEVVYEKRFNPELFKKVYLLAWGDGKDFVVNFKDINYEIE